jgi:ribonuclease HII
MPVKPGIQYIIGIDEVGRGPLAGPVAVGAVMVPADYLTGVWATVKDSKQLSEKGREAWLAKTNEAVRAGDVRYAVCFGSHERIDTRGIVPTIRSLVSRSLKKLDADPAECLVLLDGGLRAPARYRQQTIIRGDAKEPVIALASIAAKVARDRVMVRLSKKYPAYGFERHKGYGTQGHYEVLATFGPCEIHRRSFLRSFFDGNVGGLHGSVSGAIAMIEE